MHNLFANYCPQASSDFSALDFDIPFAYAFSVAGAIEIVVTIGVMASVTWQVLIVGVFATVGSKYVQVRLISRICFSS